MSTLLPESALKQRKSALKAEKAGRWRKYRNKEGKMVKVKIKAIPLKELQARWKKKKEHLENISRKIRSLRTRITKDLKSDDEKEFLTALVINVMDCTAERVGNNDSARNGHFGVTGFRKKHIRIDGNKVTFRYTGKAGVKHEKIITDKELAENLKRAIKNSKSKFVFETSNGFRIKNDKVNRYLSQFGIKSKNIRGYCANTYVINQLKKEEDKNETLTAEQSEKKRKAVFNKAVKWASTKVGHGVATLKNHYLMPEVGIAYIQRGEIINLIDFYSNGGDVTNDNSKDAIHRVSGNDKPKHVCPCTRPVGFKKKNKVKRFKRGGDTRDEILKANDDDYVIVYHASDKKLDYIKPSDASNYKYSQKGYVYVATNPQNASGYITMHGNKPYIYQIKIKKRELLPDTGFIKIHGGKNTLENSISQYGLARIKRQIYGSEIKQIKLFLKGGNTFSKHPSSTLLAPNGKPSNLNVKQYALVRTPEFKAWFGDWDNDPKNASKVVDENGEPLIVYHGTGEDEIDIFNTDIVSFTPYKDVAIGYRKDRKQYSDKKGKLIGVFLKMLNPKELELAGENWSRIFYKNKWRTTDDITEYEKEEGNYDGVIFKDIDDFPPDYSGNRDYTDTYSVFEPNQIKLADGSNTTFDAGSDDIRFEEGGALPTPNSHLPAFYSNAQQRIASFKQPRASVTKWKEIIGIKTDEIKYTEIPAWLNSFKPNEQLSKEDVLEFVKRYEIKLAIKYPLEKEVIEFENLPDSIKGDVVDYQNGDLEFEELIDKWVGIGVRFVKKDGRRLRYFIGDIKYEKYQLPGEATRYTEILVTLPNRTIEADKEKVYSIINNDKEYTEYHTKAENAREIQRNYYMGIGEVTAQQNKDASDDYYKYSKLASGRATELAGWYQQSKTDYGTYVSSHWDGIENIIVHLRTNIRPGVPASAILPTATANCYFLEELQSDWAQQGKREGFEKTRDEIKQELERLKKEFNSLDFNNQPISKFYNDFSRKIYGKKYTELNYDESTEVEYQMSLKDKEEYRKLNIEHKKLHDERASIGITIDFLEEYLREPKGIPRAPYVTDTNAWVKLGLKVALQQAINNGCTALAWATGEQQNDRYDFSKYIQEIYWWYNEATKLYDIKAFDKKGEEVVWETGINIGRIEELIGKEIAEKIKNHYTDTLQVQTIGNIKSGIIKHEGLKVAGKGMIHFYGSATESGIIGNVAKALIKELTGKTGEIVEMKITKSTKWDELTIDDVGGKAWETIGASILFRDGDYIIYGNMPENAVRKHSSLESAKKEAEKYLYTSQPGIIITDEIKNAVKKGVALFEQGGSIELNSGKPETLNFKLGTLYAKLWSHNNNLVAYAQHISKMLLAGHHFKNKIEHEKIAKTYGIQHADIAKEWAEYAVVITARKIVEENAGNTKQTFDKLTDLYTRQPSLTHRTSTTITKQQYSTPAPIAYLMNYWATNSQASDDEEKQDNLNKVLKYAYKKGDKVVFIGAGGKLIKAIIDLPSTVKDDGTQVWLTDKGYIAENEVLPYITSAKQESGGQGYKMFKGIGNGKNYRVEFADGNHYTSYKEDRESAIMDAIRHRLYTVKNYPKTKTEVTEAKELQEYEKMFGKHEGTEYAELQDQFPVPNAQCPMPNPLFFEPTAGTGLLTIATPPENWVVNEIDRTRLDILRLQGFASVLSQDATNKITFPKGVLARADCPLPLPSATACKAFSAIVANPPFGNTHSIKYGTFTLTGLEQLISARALEYMKDDGKCALIIGGNTEYDERGRIKSKKDLVFFNYLAKHYNLIDVINISPELFRKQGAVYPTRIILISGTQSGSNTYYPLADFKADNTTKFSTKPVDNLPTLYSRILGE